MNRKTVIASAAAAGALALVAATGFALPAEADHVGEPVWHMPVELSGPGTSTASGTVQVLDCRTAVIKEHRTEGNRASRYHRIAWEFPAVSQVAQWPNNQVIESVISSPASTGKRVGVHSWTDGVGSLDLNAYVIFPSCSEDFNPRT